MSKRTAVRILVLAALFGWAALLFGLTVQPFVLPTGSMEPTIHSGDRFLVLKQFLAGPVRRGDLVSMRYPVDPRQIFVKRVVGVPGDRLHLLDKQLYLNGKPAHEPYAEHLTDYFDSYRDNFPNGEPNPRLHAPAARMLRENRRGDEIVIPPGYYFVLGDNRDASFDSRYFGLVPAADVLGRPVYVYASARGHARRLQRVPLQ